MPPLRSRREGIRRRAGRRHHRGQDHRRGQPEGGVGLTTTAINLAAGLAKAGKSAAGPRRRPPVQRHERTRRRARRSPPARRRQAAGRVGRRDLARTAERPAGLAESRRRGRALGLEPPARVEPPPAAHRRAGRLRLRVHRLPPLARPAHRARQQGRSNAQVYIPIQCEYFAMEGLSQIIELARQTKAKDNHRLEIGGIVLTMYDPALELANEVAGEVRGYFGLDRLPTPRSRARTSTSARRPSHGIQRARLLAPGQGGLGLRGTRHGGHRP